MPVFILIREPKEAITSYYLKHYALLKKEMPSEVNVLLLKKLTDEYLSYYKFVDKFISKIHLISFEILIKDPYQTLEKINKIAYEDSNIFNEEDINRIIKSYRGANDTLGSSRPNPEKEKIKNELKKDLFEFKEYKETLSPFKTLKDYENQ
jgi:hypothetical protein